MSSGPVLPLIGRGTPRHEASLEDFHGAETWPMPVNRFFAGDYLRRSDIVLTRKAGNPFSYFIRWSTGSMFSHSALVFHPRDRADGFNHTFVIEAGTDGVDITNLKDYASSPYYVVAIKRFEAPWFGDDLQRYVRGILLDRIKDEYDFWRVITMARAIFRSVFLRDLRPFRSKDPSKRWIRIRRGANANEFICSGLVQYGYFYALYKLARAQAKGAPVGQEGHEALKEIESGGRGARRLDGEMLKAVLFSPEAEARLDLDDGCRFRNFKAMRRFWNALHATTPRDLEESPKLTWLYAIRNGLVHKISTDDEVRKLSRAEIVLPHDEATV